MGEPRVKLTGQDLRKRAVSAPDWRVTDDRLSKSFFFSDFQAALDFVNRIGAVAEEQGHHPDLHLTWGRVDVETSTHEAGGITESDFTLAVAIDEQFLKR